MIAPWALACSARPAALSAAPAETAVWNEATAGGRYRLTLRPEDGRIPIGPIHRWIVEVRGPQGAFVEDASIVVGGGMEGHGHGLPTAPKVTDSPSPGVYLIDGMKFSMAGEWTITLRVESGGMPDSARFLIDVAY